jgi:Fe2+ or Zn2+ uptake regulation protein
MSMLIEKCHYCDQVYLNYTNKQKNDFIVCEGCGAVHKVDEQWNSEEEYYDKYLELVE